LIALILVTGATGFLGTYLIPRLVENGYKVRCLVRQSSDTSLLKRLNVETTYGDITDKTSIEASLDNVDIIVHLATVLNSSDASIYEVNVKGAENLIDAVKNKKREIRKIIMLSSATVLKNTLHLSYPKTKLMAETLFLNSGLNCIVIRPTWIYGKGSKSFGNLIKNIKKLPFIPVIGNGQARMQPVYVDDVIHLILLLIDNIHLRNKIYHIGGSSALSFDELLNGVSDDLEIKKIKIHIPIFIAKMVMTACKMFSIKPPISDDFISDVTQDVVVDNSALKEEFNFVPISFEEGFKAYGRYLE